MMAPTNRWALDKLGDDIFKLVCVWILKSSPDFFANSLFGYGSNFTVNHCCSSIQWCQLRNYSPNGNAPRWGSVRKIINLLNYVSGHSKDYIEHDRDLIEGSWHLKCLHGLTYHVRVEIELLVGIAHSKRSQLYFRITARWKLST